MLRSLSQKTAAGKAFGLFRSQFRVKSAKRCRVNFSKSSIVGHRIISYRDLSDLKPAAEELGPNTLENYVGSSNNNTSATFRLNFGPKPANNSKNLACQESPNSSNSTPANQQQSRNSADDKVVKSCYEYLKTVLNKPNYRAKISGGTLIWALKGSLVSNDGHGFVSIFDKWWALLYDRLHEVTSNQLIICIMYLGFVNKATDGALRQVLHRWHIQALETQFLVASHIGKQDFLYSKLMSSFCDLYTPKDYFLPCGFPSRQTVNHVMKYIKENPPTVTLSRLHLTKSMKALAILNVYPEYEDFVFLTNLFKKYFDLYPKIGPTTPKSLSSFNQSPDSSTIIAENIEIDAIKPEDIYVSRDQAKIFDQSDSIEEEREPVEHGLLSRDTANSSLNEDSDLTAFEKSIDSNASDDFYQPVVESRDQIDINQLTERSFELHTQIFNNFAHSFVYWRVDPDHVTPGSWRAWFNGVQNLLALQKMRAKTAWPEKELADCPRKYQPKRLFKATELVKLVKIALEVAQHFEKVDEFYEIEHLCNDVLQKYALYARDSKVAQLLETIKLFECQIKGRALTRDHKKLDNNHIIKNATLLSVICNKAESFESFMEKHRKTYKLSLSKNDQSEPSTSKTDQSDVSSGKISQLEVSSTKIGQSNVASSSKINQSEMNAAKIDQSADFQLSNNKTTESGTASGQEFFDNQKISIDGNQIFNDGRIDKAKLYE